MTPGAAHRLILAFDFGLTRIGVACGQGVTRTASPVGTLTAKRGQPDWTAVDAMVKQWGPSRLVVGLPLNMDGTVSDMAQQARSFGAALALRYDLPIEFIDERLTSFEARGMSADVGARHAVAACLIAETFLNADS